MSKNKNCKNCKKKFEVIRFGQVVCGYDCAMQIAIKNKKRDNKKNWNILKKKGLEDLRSLGDWKKLLQNEINAIARLIDKDQRCISCNGVHGKPQAGHYHTVVSNPAIRFNLHNIHIQDYRCNVEKSGNITGYNRGLVDIYGREYFDYVCFDLIRENKVSKMHIFEIKSIIKKSREVVRHLLFLDMIFDSSERIAIRNYYNGYLGV